MGRGRGRGRGKASVTASPVASAVEPPSNVCMKTTYDGVDDYYKTTSATVKITGAGTVAFELDMNSITTNDSPFHCRGGTTGGMWIYFGNNLGTLTYAIGGGGGLHSNGTTANGIIQTGAGFQKILITWGLTNKATVYVDDVLVSTGDDNLTVGMTSPGDMTIGTDKDAVSRVLDGSMRNIYWASGETSTPTSYDPEDPDGSLTGTTRVFFSSDGSGANDEGISFTKFGDPVTSEC